MPIVFFVRVWYYNHGSIVRGIAHVLKCGVDDLLGIKPPQEPNDANIVDQTGLSPLAVSVLVSYEKQAENKDIEAIQAFLSDLICSNTCLNL